MPAQEIIDWVVRVIVALGIPTAVGKHLYTKRQERLTRAGLRKESAQAYVEELTTPDKIRSSSITTLEAERVAMTKSFEADRAVKDATVNFLTTQLAGEREYSRSRDVIITELRKQVEHLQAQLAEIADKLNGLDHMHDSAPSKTSPSH